MSTSRSRSATRRPINGAIDATSSESEDIKNFKSPFPSPPISPKLAHAVQLRLGTLETDAPPRTRYPERQPSDLDKSYFPSLTYGIEAEESDPLLLRERLHPEASINQLRHRKSDKKSLGNFYDRQNTQIASMLKPMDRHIEEAKEDQEENRMAIKIAVYASLIANM
jgi:hypothetical protein